jgi:hypothetical protein
MAGVPLPLGIKGRYPCLEHTHSFVLLPNHSQQVHDQVTRLLPLAGIKEQTSSHSFCFSTALSSRRRNRDKLM